MVFRRRGRRIARPRRKTAAKKAPVHLSPRMKSAIKRVVAPAEEIKYIAKTWDTQTIASTLSTAGGANLYKMVPDVQQGTYADNRIANSLNPKGLRTHFAMYFPNATVMTTNVYIRLLCVSSRQVKDYALAGSLPGGDLFLDGAGGSQDLAGSYADNLSSNQFLPVNKKSWIVHHDKIFHLARGYGYLNNDTTPARQPTGTVPAYQRVTLDVPFPVALKFDRDTDLIANNFAPFWCAYIWTADGGTITTNVQVSTRTDLYFVG